MQRQLKKKKRPLNWRQKVKTGARTEERRAEGEENILCWWGNYFRAGLFVVARVRIIGTTTEGKVDVFYMRNKVSFFFFFRGKNINGVEEAYGKG